jgi:eukaryotic-like serine/threonine-protein kinase
VTLGTPGYLGPYRLLNVVHTGHTTQIWQAYWDAKQRMVGIKTIIDEFRHDREHVGYLYLEYKVGVALSHPRVLEIYTYDRNRGAPYLAMEWFPAPNLKQRMLQGRQRIAHQLSRIIDQAAEALDYFNRQGWVHRDVKPDNFLVSEVGDIKLIDFALARPATGGWAKLLARASWSKAKVQGTRSYMSPEQIRGDAIDQRADVYSFGCTVHELISGKPPFTGASSQELLNKHLRSAPPFLEASDRNVTPEFSQLIRRALSKDPAARPPSMAEFRAELRAIKLFKVPPPPPPAESH